MGVPLALGGKDSCVTVGTGSNTGSPSQGLEATAPGGGQCLSPLWPPFSIVPQEPGFLAGEQGHERRFPGTAYSLHSQ